MSALIRKIIKDKKNIKFFLAGGVAVIILIALFLIGSNNTSDDNLIGNDSSSHATVGKNAVLYEEKYSFVNFTDPKENAFTMKIPKGWQASSESGVTRNYIDAGVLLQVYSSKNQGFVYISPYGVYTTPNSLLDFAGFTEGTYYDPSGGISRAMLVKKFTEAKDFLNEYVAEMNVNAQVLEVKERNDLINQNPSQLVTRQSAAEITYLANGLKYKLIDYNYLIELSGTGIWAATLLGYYSPEALFNETEYLVLQSEQSFKVNPSWAAKEAQEMNRRAGIISSTQDSISESISSSFEYKTDSQDRISNEWSKTTLGIEEVYNPETGETRYPEAGASYYWQDNRGNIYGTETDESPLPLEDMTKLEIKKDV